MLVVFFRAVILYILIMFCIRMMGKRQLGELQPSELVITILISNIASLPIEDTGIPLILGAIPVLVLVSCEIFISNISLKSKKFRKFVSGSPMIVIHDGVIDQLQLRKLRFSIDDLMESLRQANIFDIRDVEYAVVETTGKVSILQKFHAQNTTPKMLGIKGGKDQTPPVVVVSDGIIINDAMKACGIDEKFVYSILDKHRCTLKQAFLMTCDQKRDIHFVKKTIN